VDRASVGGGGLSCLYEENIYFERNMGAYFCKHFTWLKYFTCHLSGSAGTGYEL
jgi:hypothetical protein